MSRLPFVMVSAPPFCASATFWSASVAEEDSPSELTDSPSAVSTPE